VDVMVCVGVRECVGMNVFVKRGHRNIPFHCLLDQSPTEQISFLYMGSRDVCAVCLDLSCLVLSNHPFMGKYRDWKCILSWSIPPFISKTTAPISRPQRLQLLHISTISKLITKTTAAFTIGFGHKLTIPPQQPQFHLKIL
jgi:hypothetical protein